MRVIDTTLLHLIGQAFLGDPYSPDRATLRWYLDPGLGLPRRPFVLERRPSLLSPRGLSGVQVVKDEVSALFPEGNRLVGSQIAISTLPVPAEELLEAFPTPPSVPAAKSSAIDLTGGVTPMPGAVCWVQATVQGPSGGGPPGGMLLVAGQRNDRGQLVTVSRLTATGSAPQQLMLAAPRIDRLLLWGDLEMTTISIVDVTTLDAAPGWGSLNHVPVVTPTHIALLPRPFGDIEIAARAVVTPTGFPGPRAQHPLDEPPTHDPGAPRPATQAAVDARYIRPWLHRLEPAVARVLAESARPIAAGAGRLHQSEVVETRPMTHLGSDDPLAPQGLPPDLASTNPTLDVPLLAFLLLAAVTDVQTAKLLGLAVVPEEPLKPGDIWDYRLVADWERDDLTSWPAALERRLAVLSARAGLPGLEPSRLLNEANEIAVVKSELARAVWAVDLLLAVAGAGNPVSIAAFALGIEMAARRPFDPPAGLTLTPRGSARPGSTTGVVEVAWKLRQRYRTDDDRLVPAGAVIGRLGASPERYLNPENPDPTLRSVPQAFLPAADGDAPGGGGTTRLVDRSAPLNQPLEYWVAECDPFGRWSTWIRGGTQVNHHAAPDPVPCEVLLEESPTTTGAHRLTVGFDWDPNSSWDGGLVKGSAHLMSFVIGVRPALPPVAQLRERTAWATLERQVGTGAGPFTVPGGTAGLTTTHDGMAVSVAAPVDVTVLVSGGPPVKQRLMRRYAVTFDGLRLTPSAGGRVRCYTSVATSHATEGPSVASGAPALAEYIPTTPPSLALMPPDPLWASLPDAENRSTVRLTWLVPNDSAATAIRYQVLCAGENEVAAAAAARTLPTGDPRRTERDQAQGAYLAAASLAFRADALKRLAVFAEDVFAIAADRLTASAAAQPMTALCELTGSLRTLTVYCVRGASAVGNASTWPSAPTGFAVVAVPQPAIPSPPVVMRAAEENGVAQLRVARPGVETAEVAGYELYRTTDPDRAAGGDFRRMALANAVPVGATTWQGPTGAQFAVLEDADARTDERYFYAVVARAPGVGGAAGTRSRPSAVVGVNLGEPPAWVMLPRVPGVGLPTLVRRPAGRLDVLVRAGDGRLRICSADGPVRSGWEPLDGAAPNGTEVVSDPAAWALTDAGPEVVAVMPDGLLRWTAPAATGWAPWQEIPGSQRLRSPALTGGDQGLALAALDVKGRVRCTFRSNGVWEPWTTVGALIGAQTVAVAVDLAGEVHFAVFTDDGQCHYTWGSAGAWQAWTVLGGPFAVTRPVLLHVPGVRTEVLVRDVEGALLRHRISQFAATPWELMERRPPGPVAAVLADDTSGSTSGQALELVTRDQTGALLRRRWKPPSATGPIA